jgi:conjugative transfer signal peptidase TraF
MRLLAVSAVASVLVGGSYGAGLHWNLSPSMPAGIWRVATFHGPALRGEAVALCLPRVPAAIGRIRGYLDAGDCPNNVEVLIKTVAAIHGDQVTMSDDGITVNGVLLRNSRPMASDDLGRPLLAMPNGSYVVGDGEVWIISGHDPRSYDSRYFGAVPISNIRGRAMPLLIAAN